MLHVALHIAQVEEALVALRQAGNIPGGEQRVVFHGDQRRVNHRILGRTGVYAQTVEMQLRRTGVERLVSDFALFAAIQRVGEICVKFVHIEEIHTLADFFIRGKGNANISMGNFGMCEKIFCGSENFGNACFIIRAKQGGAV